MYKRMCLVVLSAIVALMIISGCSLDAQGDKNRAAFNGLMTELKKTQMMEGNVGNVNWDGNNIVRLTFTDSSLPREEMKKTLGHVITYYANSNNSVGTGVTMLKVIASSGGKEVLKVVYNAGPSHSVEDNLTFTWMDGGEEV